MGCTTHCGFTAFTGLVMFYSILNKKFHLQDDGGKGIPPFRVGAKNSSRSGAKNSSRSGKKNSFSFRSKEFPQKSE